MNPIILPNNDPNLRLIVATWDQVSQHACVETLPILAWWVAPPNQPSPICLRSLLNTDWALEDCRTGCVEIRDDGVYRRDDAVKTLMELARIRYEANQTEALLAADVEI